MIMEIISVKEFAKRFEDVNENLINRLELDEDALNKFYDSRVAFEWNGLRCEFTLDADSYYHMMIALFGTRWDMEHLQIKKDKYGCGKLSYGLETNAENVNEEWNE